MAETIALQPIEITEKYEPPKVSFDFDGAKAAGISSNDVVKELERSGKLNFDFAGARKAGISDEEIYQELYNRSQASNSDYDLDSIEPGAPDDEYADLDPQAAPEEPTTELTPKLVQNIDTQSTNPMQSMMTYDEKGQATPMTVGTDAYSQDQAIAAEREKRDKESDWYIDPVTGERVASSKISGQAEPDYPMLVGTRLGVFGGPGMLGEAAIKTLAHDTAKFSSELLGKADELLGNSHLKNFAGPEGGVSNEAKIYLARHATNPEITEDVIAQVLAGVKTSDQAYVLARFFGDANFIKQAVRGDGDSVAALLRADLVRGKQKVVNAVGEVDVEGAMAKYADVKEHLRSTEGTVVRDASILKQAADAIVAKFRPQDTTTGAVQLVSDSGYGLAIRMQNLLANTNNKLSLSQAFEMRPEINSLLRKARDPLEKANLKLMKDNLDDFISTMATPEQKAMVDDAVSTYARTMENRDVLEIINKFTKDNIAVNWTGLHRALNDAGLGSPEAVDALRITEAFSKKFGNDAKLAAYAKAAGSNLDAGGAMGAYGSVVNFFKNHFTMWGNRSDNLKIQKAILNSLKNSKTNYDFVDNIRANKNIPDEFKGKDLDQAILQIEYKPGAHQTGDVNLEPIVTPVGGTEAARNAIINNIKAGATKIDDLPANIQEQVRPYVSATERIDTLLSNEARTVDQEAELRGLQDKAIDAGLPKDEVDSFVNDIRNGGTGVPRVEKFQTVAGSPRDYSSQELRDIRDEIDTIHQQNRTSETRDWLDAIDDELDRRDIARTLNSYADSIETGDIDVDDVPSQYLQGIRSYFPEGGSTQRQIDERLGRPSSLTEDIEYTSSFPTLSRQQVARQGPGEASSKVAELQSLYDDTVSQVRRLERIRVADRTPAEQQQLTDLRSNRLQASRALQRAQANVPTHEKFIESMNSSGHNISIIGNPNSTGSRFKIEFNGTTIPLTIERNGAVSLNTTSFIEGSGQGKIFYEAFYNALDASGLIHRLTGLTQINQMRLPIALLKHKHRTGNLPIEGGQAKLRQLMSTALDRLGGRLRDNGFGDIGNASDEELKVISAVTGPMPDIHAGLASLKLYRRAAQVMKNGGTLSIAALLPFLDAAYEEGQ